MAKKQLTVRYTKQGLVDGIKEVCGAAMAMCGAMHPAEMDAVRDRYARLEGVLKQMVQDPAFVGTFPPGAGRRFTIVVEQECLCTAHKCGGILYTTGNTRDGQERLEMELECGTCSTRYWY